METFLNSLRDAVEVAIGFLGANAVLGAYVSFRMKKARKDGLKRLAEAESQMREYFGEAFDAVSDASDPEDAG